MEGLHFFNESMMSSEEDGTVSPHTINQHPYIAHTCFHRFPISYHSVGLAVFLSSQASGPLQSAGYYPE